MYVVPTGRLHPGETVATTGVYRVYHHAHRLPHSVFVPAGTILPKCRRCGDKVEFGLLLESDSISSDHDLLELSDRLNA